MVFDKVKGCVCIALLSFLEGGDKGHASLAWNMKCCPRLFGVEWIEDRGQGQGEATLVFDKVKEWICLAFIEIDNNFIPPTVFRGQKIEVYPG
jgi:hypothetical protein